VSDYIASPWAVLFLIRILSERKDGHLKKNQITTAPPQVPQPVIMRRRIGRTTYHIRVHQSESSTETAQTKLSRLIRLETMGKAANL